MFTPTSTTKWVPVQRRKYRAARAFYVTLFILMFLAGGTFLLDSTWTVDEQLHLEKNDGEKIMLPISERLSLHEVAAPLSRRDETWPISLFDQTEDEECRGVHHLPRAERCAFIRTHCGADEPGFHACLEFYYCRLPHASAVSQIRPINICVCMCLYKFFALRLYRIIANTMLCMQYSWVLLGWLCGWAGSSAP